MFLAKVLSIPIANKEVAKWGTFHALVSSEAPQTLPESSYEKERFLSAGSSQCQGKPTIVIKLTHNVV